MYDIQVSYRTGNSFNTYDKEHMLEGNWNLETAKINLKRIKEHYLAYNERNNFVSCSMRDKEKDLLENIKTKEWYSGEYWEYSLNLVENDGSINKCSCCWIGYFETLYGAEIKELEDGEMSFTVNCRY